MEEDDRRKMMGGGQEDDEWRTAGGPEDWPGSTCHMHPYPAGPKLMVFMNVKSLQTLDPGPEPLDAHVRPLLTELMEDFGSVCQSFGKKGTV